MANGRVGRADRTESRASGRSAALLLLWTLAATAAGAQTTGTPPVQAVPPEPIVPPATTPVPPPVLPPESEASPPGQAQPGTAPPAEAPGAAEAGEAQAGEEPPPPRDEERFLPRLDIYFPEGDLDLRVNRLINKVFFEGQVKYNFIDGDITAFLRYRYYGYNRITQFTVFDSVEFDDIEEFSEEFDRVRGILLMRVWPHSYYRRSLFLVEADRIASNKEVLQFNNNTTNTYVRLGYQIGTPEDSRSNAIAGESRARRERLFTAIREIGPGQSGLTGALTYSFDAFGDYKYVKGELEALKRFDVSRRTFLVTRLHAGSFPYKKTVRFGEELEEVDTLSIPRNEFFRLDGRENLKGLGDRRRGTEEIHATFEYFFPWFLGEQHRVFKLDWQNWYWILYTGIGNIGFDNSIFGDFSSYIPDAGIGFEASVQLKKYRFFLSGVVAQTLKESDGVEAHISVKSYH